MAWQMVVAGAQMGLGLWQGYQAKKAAYRVAKRQAAAYSESAGEEIRRLKMQQEVNMGNLEVAQAGSGLLNAGSTSAYKQFVMGEQERQLKYAERIKKLNEAAIIKGGQAQGQAAFTTSAIQGVSAGLGTMSSYWQSQQAPSGGNT